MLPDASFLRLGIWQNQIEPILAGWIAEHGVAPGGHR
jgi:hypothetical protein